MKLEETLHVVVKGALFSVSSLFEVCSKLLVEDVCNTADAEGEIEVWVVGS